VSDSSVLGSELTEEIERITGEVSAGLAGTDSGIGVEAIQDLVEEKLMQSGYYRVARRYIVYREEHQRARSLGEGGSAVELWGEQHEPGVEISVARPNGSTERLDPQRIRQTLERACGGLESVDPGPVFQATVASLYSGVDPARIRWAMVLSARSFIEVDPSYSKVAARLLLDGIYRQAWDGRGSRDLESAYRESFEEYLQKGVRAGRLSPDLLEFDLARLSSAFVPERDLDFEYLGLQTLYDRYLIQAGGTRIETPQHFWMRVAMGLSLNEEDREERAIEFYEALSSFRVVSATPTLFNSGTNHPQLSSCYLTTVGDDLESIFKAVSDNARLSKWAGGLGNDWTNVRATGAHISGTGGDSQGIVPFLKIINDTAVAVNQGGKRKGAACCYLESWHLDLEDFLELRKNTGDERRRTHDMNTANWVPDLFVKRVLDDGRWTLFSPDETPDLHEVYGREFERRYLEYERRAREGLVERYRVVEAGELWKKMLSMLFETGHPWITFKDPSNLRSPQDHAGVVHSSNLCTEILLNTSSEETAVCNLASINLGTHTNESGLDREMLARTVETSVRMLDNVIDINFYPTQEARASNLRHRPVGLGVMGFQDALYKQRLAYGSDGAAEFADHSMEAISYHAITASSELAGERGAYESYEGSKWSRGLLPIDTIDTLERERGVAVEMDRESTLDWERARALVAANGMRNSNVLAIAPTATISNISGVYQSIEPLYSNLFVKSNLSGEFTSINPYLIEDLKARGLWDEEMLEDLKYFDGSVREIERVPDDLKHLYATAFEIEPEWLIECASRRQKWLDMGQSLNLYLDHPSGSKLSRMYIHAWRKGLKTTYYLRTRGATSVEKSNHDVNRRGIQPRWMRSRSASSEPPSPAVAQSDACSTEDTECEACQ